MSTTYLVTVKVAAAGLDDAKAKAKAAGFELADAAKKTDALGGAFRKLATVVGGISLAQLGRESLRFAVDFDRSLLKLQTQVGATAAEVALLRAEVLRLGPELGRSPLELSEALYAIESAGITGARALDILREAGMGAAIELGSAKDLALATVAATTAYAAAGLTAADATAQFAATVRLGNLEAAQLAPQLGEIIPLGAQLGVSFAELGANLATFTRLGTPASQAVTSLKGILSALLAPSKEAEKALAGMGLSADDLRAAVRERGLAQVLGELVAKFQGNSSALKDLFPEITAVANVLGTAGAQGKVYVEIAKEISAATGGLAAEFAKLKDSPGQALNQLTSSLDVLKIKVGDELALGLASASGGVQNLAKNLDSLADIAGAVGQTLGGLLSIIGKLSEYVDLVGAGLVIFGTVKLRAAILGLDALAAKSVLARVALLNLGGAATTAGNAAAASAAGWSVALGAVSLLAVQAGRYRDQLAAAVQGIINETNAAQLALDNITREAGAAIASGDYDTIARSLGTYTAALNEAELAEARLVRQEEAARAKLGELSAALAANRAASEAAGRPVGKLSREYFDLKRQLDVAEKELGKATEAYNKGHLPADRYRKAVEALGVALEAAKKKQEETVETLVTLGESAEESRKRLEALKKQLDAIEKAKLEVAAQAARELAQSMDALGGTAGGVLSNLDRVEAAISAGLDPMAALLRDTSKIDAVTLAWLDKLVLAGKAAETLASQTAYAAEQLDAAIGALVDPDVNRVLLGLGNTQLGLGAQRLALPGFLGGGAVEVPITLDVDEEDAQQAANELADYGLQAFLAANDGILNDWGLTVAEMAHEWDSTVGEMLSSAAGFADALGDIVGGALGDALSGLGGALDAYRSYQTAQNPFDRFSAGADLGASVFGIGQSLGVWQGDRGVSAFGGQRSGDYADIGAQLGGAFFGVWGALIGGVIGGFVRKGADEIDIFLQDDSFTGELTKSYNKYAQRLSGVGNDIADSIIDGLEQFERILGIELGDLVGGLSFNIRDDTLTVKIAGLVREFTEDQVGQAIEFAIVTYLQNADFTGGTKNVRAALEHGQHFVDGSNIGSLDELQSVLDFARQLDEQLLRPMEIAIKQWTEASRQAISMAVEYGLSATDTAALIRKSFEELRQNLEDSILSLAGGDALIQVRKFQELQQAFADFNAGVDAANALINEAATTTTSFGNAALDFSDSAGGAGGHIGENIVVVDELADHIKTTSGVMADAAEETKNLNDVIHRLDPELIEMAAQALNQSLQQDLFDRLIALGEQAGIDIEGQLEAAGILAQWREAQFQLEIAQARLLLEAIIAAGKTSEAVIAFLEDTLDQLENADIDFDAPPTPNLGGGGGSGAAQRAETRQRLLREIELLELGLGGVAAAAIDVVKTIEGIREWEASARDAGLAAANIARGVAAQTQTGVDAFLAPFRESILAAGETEAETSLRQLAEQQEAALQAAMAWAEQLAAVTGEAVGDVFAEMSAVILESAQIQRDEIAADLAAAEAERVAAAEAERAAILEGVAGLGGSTLTEQTTAALAAISAAVADLTDRAEAAGFGVEDLAAVLSDIAAESAAAQLQVYRDHVAGLGQAMGQLGLQLPVEITRALAAAEIALQQSRVLEILANEQLVTSLLSLGFTAEEVGALIAGVVDQVSNLNIPALIDGRLGLGGPGYVILGPDGQPRGEGGPGGATPGVPSRSDLDAALEALAAWAEEVALAGRSLTPFEAAMLRLEDRFEDLRETLTKAGASAADLARLEEVYATAREQALQKALDATREGLQSFLDSLAGGSQVSPRQTLDAALAEFNAAAAALGDDPTDAAALGAYQTAGRALLDLARQLTLGGQGPVFDRLLDLMRGTTAEILGAGIPGDGLVADVVPFPAADPLAAGRFAELDRVREGIDATNDRLERIESLLAGRQVQAARLASDERIRADRDRETLRRLLTADAATRRAAAGGGR